MFDQTPLLSLLMIFQQISCVGMVCENDGACIQDCATGMTKCICSPSFVGENCSIGGKCNGGAEGRKGEREEGGEGEAGVGLYFCMAITSV